MLLQDDALHSRCICFYTRQLLVSAVFSKFKCNCDKKCPQNFVVVEKLWNFRGNGLRALKLDFGIILEPDRHGKYGIIFRQHCSLNKYSEDFEMFNVPVVGSFCLRKVSRVSYT